MEQVGSTGTEHEVATSPHGSGRWVRHPSPREYVRIAVVLALVTAAEVAIYYLDWVHEHGLLIPLLFAFSLVKFSLVVLWFMHLRFDSRTYARFFLLGIAGALTLFTAVLLMFRTFAG
ncbi:MAG TPA: cytochrome C oxidase subunit IV family protein [Actinomycetota bacterium]|nr:cytochrome C oxidase subunit IV family protein [Actinomycetota bacterium]